MFIWEAGRDVCRDRTFARTGRLLGRDVCRDGTFAGTGRLLGRAYMRMYVSTRDDFTRDNLQSQHNIARQSATECVCDKNCPAFTVIHVERTEIPLYWDGAKNVPVNILSI